MQKTYFRFVLWIILFVCAMLEAGCATQSTITPVVQTVVQTIPVEVTKVVEITRPVEVTREVVVTQVIQVPVTVTPQGPTATQTPSPSPTYVINLTPETPQVTPKEKGTGLTEIFIYNQTKDKIDLIISGPTVVSLVLWPGDEQRVWVREGVYTYTVLENGQAGYTGSFKIVNPDKHEFVLYEAKAILRGP